LKFWQAIHEATDLCMAKDPSVLLMGLGVPDPKGVFGTTLGLVEKYGPERVTDMPTSENGMTGVAIGAAISGMRPILTHQRVDFAVLTMEQLVNQAAKWHYMFGGRMRVPLVVRMLIGRGWGQGPQHSQSLQAWFGHVPGLKVVMPATPYDAKGLLISAIEDDNPVIVLEHRWLYNISGPVPEGVYRVPIGKARVLREGSDVTIVSVSYMTLEALRAADLLARHGIAAEVIDARSVRPWDAELVLDSVRRTGRLIVSDNAWKTLGFSAEVVARVAEAGVPLESPPRRVCYPDWGSPTSPALAAGYYPRAVDIEAAAAAMFGIDPPETHEAPAIPLDVPDMSFTGPF
jgi:pyruvate dehydrogenase E1 component beta subunit